jgi:hypothetical protein
MIQDRYFRPSERNESPTEKIFHFVQRDNIRVQDDGGTHGKSVRLIPSQVQLASLRERGVLAPREG